MATILITGGTGLVGKHLCDKLQEKGYDVAILSRTKKEINGTQVYTWNLDKELIDKKALETADYIIHLAGANIAEKRWTPKRKQLIIDSRVKTAELIFNNIKRTKHKLKAFISASAIGYYGAVTSDKTFSEVDSCHNDFLGETCKLWEEAADKFEELEIRTVKIRTGVVLTKKGGALAKMKTPVKMGIASAIDSGNQYMPWIHIDDLCNIYIKAIEDVEMKGIYNAVAPEHVTNIEFTRKFASVLNKPFWFPNIPAFIMKLIFGEMSVILLEGSKVSSEKIKKSGYKFIYSNLISALKNLHIT
jgi:uncharacterized protein (TIGR01777 family)